MAFNDPFRHTVGGDHAHRSTVAGRADDGLSIDYVTYALKRYDLGGHFRPRPRDPTVGLRLALILDFTRSRHASMESFALCSARPTMVSFNGADMSLLPVFAADLFAAGPDLAVEPVEVLVGRLVAGPDLAVEPVDLRAGRALGRGALAGAEALDREDGPDFAVEPVEVFVGRALGRDSVLASSFNLVL